MTPKEVPLHLASVTPTRDFNLTDPDDFEWLAGYFSGFHGVPGLRAERARHAALVEAAQGVAALWDDDDINPTISAWTAANDAFLALRAALDGEPS